VATSLARFGQQKPIVVDPSGVVIAGNATLAAARSLGWTHLAAVESTLTGAERTAYGIADNRSGELADWSGDVLADLIGGLDDDLRDLLEFSDAEIDELARTAADLDTLPAEAALVEDPAEMGVEPLPAITWVMLGVPTANLGEVQGQIDTLSKRPDVVIYMGMSNRDPNKKQT
jgi:ParB-like chromosome segregation protein Spo0J